MKFIFTFEEKDAQLLMEALIEMPFKKVANIINSIQKQAQEQAQGQNMPPQAPVAEAE